MNDFIIQNYINNISLNNITNYAKNEGIILKDNEAKIIYEYLKKYWKVFYYDNPDYLLKELKQKLSKETYDKLLELYKMAKEKIKNNS